MALANRFVPGLLDRLGSRRRVDLFNIRFPWTDPAGNPRPEVQPDSRRRLLCLSGAGSKRANPNIQTTTPKARSPPRKPLHGAGNLKKDDLPRDPDEESLDWIHLIRYAEH